MLQNRLKVLAVGDPAVDVYVDEKYNILSKYEKIKGISLDFYIVPWKDYYDTMMRTFEGKENYDIVMVAGHLWLKDFVNKGYLAPVEYSDTDEYDKEDILPIIMEEMKLEGKTYLYPSFCDGHILLYRKSVVKEVMGKLPPKVVSTDEVIEIAAKSHGYKNMTGIVLKAHPSEIFLDFLPYLRNEGVDAFDAKNLQPTFYNEAGIKALEKYIQLKKYAPLDTNTYGNEEVKTAFQNLKTVLAVTWGGQLGVVLNKDCQNPQDIGFAALKTSWNVTWSFAINRHSQQWQQANEFLQYLSSKEVDRIVGAYAGAPVRRSTYEKDGKLYNWYDIHLEMIEKYAKPLAKMDRAGEKLAVLYSSIEEAFNGKSSPQEALRKAEETIKTFC